MIYTGIGARKTPRPILDAMGAYGVKLASTNYILRSGGADGADLAFERGCDRVNGRKEIYLPWKKFNGSDSPLYDIPNEAFGYAADIYGSSWKYLKEPVKKFMARNIQQVLGQNLDEPTDFVLCWTPDACCSASQRTQRTGGTGQAIACASELNIPVF